MQQHEAKTNSRMLLDFTQIQSHITAALQDSTRPTFTRTRLIEAERRLRRLDSVLHFKTAANTDLSGGPDVSSLFGVQIKTVHCLFSLMHKNHCKLANFIKVGHRKVFLLLWCGILLVEEAKSGIKLVKPLLQSVKWRIRELSDRRQNVSWRPPRASAAGRIRNRKQPEGPTAPEHRLVSQAATDSDFYVW